MEDFLPILIGIIWIAYTLYSKGQKKKNFKPTHSAPKQEERPPSILEQILMGEQIKQPQPYTDFFRMEEPPVEEIQPEPVTSQKITPSPFLSDELRSFKGEGQSVSNNYSNLGKTIEEILREHEEEFEENEFDLKRAVIYSEVLNAPYIDYK